MITMLQSVRIRSDVVKQPGRLNALLSTHIDKY